MSKDEVADTLDCEFFPRAKTRRGAVPGAIARSRRSMAMTTLVDRARKTTPSPVVAEESSSDVLPPCGESQFRGGSGGGWAWLSSTHWSETRRVALFDLCLPRHTLHRVPVTSNKRPPISGGPSGHALSNVVVLLAGYHEYRRLESLSRIAPNDGSPVALARCRQLGPVTQAHIVPSQSTLLHGNHSGNARRSITSTNLLEGTNSSTSHRT